MPCSERAEFVRKENVKRRHPGDPRERWIGSGLMFAEQKFRLLMDTALPGLIAVLEA